MLTVTVLVALVGGAGLLLAWAERRYRPDSATLIEAIDALLPQTQCAQCGYPGCRPYAAAVAAGAPINLCPPGGDDTYRALADLLGRDATESGAPPSLSPPRKAVIDEERCIGCSLCVPACPVDAIVGAPQLMHTVLHGACTGCELCVAPCPVDCIALVGAPREPMDAPRDRRRWQGQPPLACIRCGACEDACPVDLQPQQLLWFSRTADPRQPGAARGLGRCIECGLCNQVCPSNIDLVGHFARSRRRVAELNAADRQAAAARARFEQHRARVEAHERDRRERRRERIAARASGTWQP